MAEKTIFSGFIDIDSVSGGDERPVDPSVKALRQAAQRAELAAELVKSQTASCQSAKRHRMLQPRSVI